MTKLLIASILAGVVAAVAFASATTGPLFTRFLLFVITPLPIFLVGLGIGWRAAAISAAAGGITLALVGNLAVGAVFTVSQMIPGVVLCYLALLNRPVAGPDGRPALEWYPVGRLILWAGALAVGVTLATLFVLGSDMETVRTSLRALVEQFMARQNEAINQGQTIKPEDIDAITDVLVAVMPGLSAISVMGALVFNLWLAGVLAKAADQLKRPWPDLAAFTFPQGTGLAFAGSLALGFAPGLLGAVGTAIGGALFLAYLLLGLAIIHHTTRGNPWRMPMLVLVYLALFFGYGVSILIALMGLLEPVSPIRRKLSGSGDIGPGDPGPPPGGRGPPPA